MIAIVAFGSWVILVLWGFVDGFNRSMSETQIRYNHGELQLRAAGYAEDPVPSNGMDAELTEGVETLLAARSDVASAPRLEGFGLLRSAYGADGVVLRGVDPVREVQVTSLHEAISDGRFLGSSGEAVLPAQLAEALDVRVGERLVLIAQGVDGTASAAFRAVGVYRVDLGTLANVVLIAIEDAQALTGWPGTTAVAVRSLRGESPSRMRAALERNLQEAALSVDVADFFALNPLARIVLQGSTVKMIPFVVLISLLAGFGVANTAFYSVLERTREFGVMTALGMSRRLLARVVLMESVFVSAIGFVIGGGIGYGCLIWLSREGLDFGELMGTFGARLGVPTVIYASASGWYWVAALSVVVFTALVAAWYPARRANRLEPVTAIREG
jgi:ABC-type lipoprotein release transport system permease subunit